MTYLEKLKEAQAALARIIEAAPAVERVYPVSGRLIHELADTLSACALESIDREGRTGV